MKLHGTFRGVNRGTFRGFTLIELMVTLTVIAVLLILVTPSFSSSVSTARERSVVQKFSQDFDWLRGRAGASSQPVVSITLDADCRWTTTVDDTTDAAHSTTSTSGLSCSSDTLTLPVQFSITAQGFATPNGTLTFTGSKGQTWPLQVLFSGSLVRLKGAS